MSIPEYNQIKTASRILRNHCGVDYNNDMYIRMAQDWFDATLDAVFTNTPLPPYPSALPQSPS